MSVNIFSKEEVEEVAYKTALLIHNGWRKNWPSGDWIHPNGKKHIRYKKFDEEDEEVDEYSLDEAYEELDLS